jgi:hypothetical protein
MDDNIDDLVTEIHDGMKMIFDCATEVTDYNDAVNNLTEIIGVYEVVIARLLVTQENDKKFDLTFLTLASLMNRIRMKVAGTDPDIVEQQGVVVDMNHWKDRNKGTIH